MILAYLMREHRFGCEEAFAYLKKIWPRAGPLNFRAQLLVWQETGYDLWVEDEKGEKVPKMEYLMWLNEREKRKEDMRKAYKKMRDLRLGRELGYRKLGYGDLEAVFGVKL